MAVTNRKQFKEQVQTHIIERLDEEYETIESQLQNVVDEFKHWYSPYEQKMIPNKYEALKSFLLGLPSCLSVEYEYCHIGFVLKKWFENCGEIYKEPKDESFLYYHLVTREFSVLCKKHGIKF